jgi:hypothetical protein
VPDVFINYRTGDGEKSATLIERELSHRFGSEKIFRASKSMIGESWSRAEALHHEDDWVRREILEALTCGIPVVPVLEGRRTERLRAAELPPELCELAEVQSLRLDLHDVETGLRRIGDQIAELVPSLKQDDRISRPVAEPGTVHNSIGTAHGTAVQARDITGERCRKAVCGRTACTECAVRRFVVSPT